MKIISLLIVSIFFLSCSVEKKVVKKERKIEKRDIEVYIPEDSEIVIKNNKFNKLLFNKNYSPSVKYEFCKNKITYLLLNHKPQGESLKLNYYYLTPVIYYHVNKFKYNIKDFDFFYYKNLYRVISLNNKELVLFSTGNDNIIGEIPLEIKVFNNNNIDLLICETNPLFYKKFTELINLKYKFSSLKSYLMIKYFKKINKNKYYKKILNDSYILIVTLSDFEEISSFKNLISNTFLHYTVDLKDIYSSKNKSLYILFNGDKIIFAKNINILKLLDKINKIPLTNLNKNDKNNGYLITKNIKYLRDIFTIFKKIKFEGKIIYYFFDYQEEYE